MNTVPILTLLTVIPLLGGAAALFINQVKLARFVAFFSSLLTLSCAALLWAAFDKGREGYQFVERAASPLPASIYFDLTILR